MPTAADAILIVRPSLIRFPPVRSRHIVYLLSVPLATTLLACGSGNDNKEAKDAAAPASPPSCGQVPPPAAQNITWVPADLPLPDGTYPVQDLGTSGDGV